MTKIYSLIAFFFAVVSISAQDETEFSEQIYDMVDVEAEYAGGASSMMNFLATNMTYPQKAVESDIQGRVYVKFVVTKKGEVTNVTLLKGMSNCQECNEEALRVVREMPNFKPAQVNGENVNAYFVLPIVFMLD
jgi:protein TonB